MEYRRLNVIFVVRLILLLVEGKHFQSRNRYLFAAISSR